MKPTSMPHEKYSSDRIEQFNQENNIMAFMNEAIPAEQKAKFDPKVFRDPHTPNYPISTSRWTIDRERDVFLIRLGGGGPWEGGDAPKPREYLALCWKGEVIKFETLYSETGRFLDGNLAGNWDVLEVYLSNVPVERNNDVLEIIRSGLEAMGDPGCARERLTKVNVHFQQQ